jgi:hypothetical protein
MKGFWLVFCLASLVLSTIAFFNCRLDATAFFMAVSLIFALIDIAEAIWAKRLVQVEKD